MKNYIAAIMMKQNQIVTLMMKKNLILIMMNKFFKKYFNIIKA